MAERSESIGCISYVEAYEKDGREVLRVVFDNLFESTKKLMKELHGEKLEVLDEEMAGAEKEIEAAMVKIFENEKREVRISEKINAERAAKKARIRELEAKLRDERQGE